MSFCVITLYHFLDPDPDHAETRNIDDDIEDDEDDDVTD